MSQPSQRIKIHWHEYIPKLVTSLKKGYGFSKFFQDLGAGITIGIISLPLGMAFAIASGLPPERGIYTSIIAGFLISALGGSRFQIGGPTGAFVVIVYDIVQRNGYEGLAVATLIAGVFLIAMGFLRFGAFLKFIPYPVITGLTVGIALVLFTSQIKDFLGLKIESVPADFLDKWQVYYENMASFNLSAFFIALGTLLIIVFFRKKYPKVPAAIIAVVIAAAVVKFFDLPVETIRSKFGGIPNKLPDPSIPWTSLDGIRILMPDAITIAILAGLESLLSAVVADGMTGYRHRSNCELVAQGLGNIGSVIFGGIPATGAIARTATNIRLGAQTPVSGVIHAVILFFILLLLAESAALIPLAALAGLLCVIAWNMAELPHVFEIFKGPKSDAALLLVTFGLAVIIDITVAVEIGILLAAIFFMKRMADATSVSRKALVDIPDIAENNDRDAIYRKVIPKGVEVFQINGPLFFGAADLLSQGVSLSKERYEIVILRMSHVSVIDMTGIRALRLFYDQCHSKGLLLCLSGVSERVHSTLKKVGLDKEIGEGHIFPHIDEALDFARAKLYGK